MANREVLKARCPSCQQDHPRTLFHEGICLFCAQKKAESASPERPKKGSSRKESAKKREALRLARREIRDKLHKARLERQRAEAEEQAEAGGEAALPEDAALQEAARRVLSREHLLPFIKRFNPKYEAGWVHKDICEHLEWFSEAVARGESPRLVIAMPPRHGKACALGTLVPTPTGMRAIETLHPGDFVFGRDGKPTRVVAVSPVWRNRELYRVTSDDGATAVVDAEHEWTVRLCRKRPVYKARSTAYLAARTSPRAPALQTYSAVEFPEAALPIPPYTLGVWLGDGCAHHATITEGAQDLDEIRRNIELDGFITSDRATAGSFGVLGLQVLLREAGLLNNKHIPPAYLYASPAQRLSLLQGLIDTDGYVAPDGQIEFCTTDEGLGASVVQLVRSLGVKASLITGRATLNGRDCGPKYRVMFYMAGAARLSRRAERCRDSARTPHRFLTFARAGRGDTVCIQVEAADQQYLVGEGYLLTHNSEIASRSFPAWHLGRHPEHEIIACSYSGALAMSFSRKVRALLRENAYQTVFENAQLDPESQSAEAWLTTKGGGYTAAGVGGAITGKGAHVLIIDDPVKSRAEAESETARETVWDWYTSTAYTRLAPGGGVLVIQTRWHDDDLTGRLLLKAAQGEGDEWRVVEYPAEAVHDELYRKRGDALHAARYPLEALARIKRAVGPRDWSALYQQNPVAEDGDFFTKGMLSYYKQQDLPPYDEMLFYTAWDLAIGQKEMNDWSVGVTVGIDRQDNLYVIDIQRGRWDSLQLADKILDVYQTWRSSITGIERGQIEMAMGPLIAKRKRERRITAFDYEPLKPGRRDKVARARSIQGRMQQKRVLFRQHCDTTQVMINELLRFPNGVHDDQVDALAYIGLLLDEFVTPRAPKVKPKKSWRDKLPAMARGNRIRHPMAA